MQILKAWFLVFVWPAIKELFYMFIWPWARKSYEEFASPRRFSWSLKIGIYALALLLFAILAVLIKITPFVIAQWAATNPYWFFLITVVVLWMCISKDIYDYKRKVSDHVL